MVTLIIQSTSNQGALSAGRIFRHNIVAADFQYRAGTYQISATVISGDALYPAGVTLRLYLDNNTSTVLPAPQAPGHNVLKLQLNGVNMVGPAVTGAGAYAVDTEINPQDADSELCAIIDPATVYIFPISATILRLRITLPKRAIGAFELEYNLPAGVTLMGEAIDDDTFWMLHAIIPITVNGSVQTTTTINFTEV